MVNSQKALIVSSIAAVMLVVGLGVALAISNDDTTTGSSEELRALATCLSDKGAKFYGAFWCPHCQEQKGDFGDAIDQVPYIECAALSGNAQTKECAEAGVTSYPTWEFPDGTRVTGRQPLATLAEATGCPAPTSIPQVQESTDPVQSDVPTEAGTEPVVATTTQE